MEEDPGLSEGYRMASPWPLLVALGLVISEVGVLFALIPVAVGGLLLFVGSIAGIVQEAGYVERPWGLLGGLGVVLLGIGFVLVVGQATAFTLDGLVGALDGAFGTPANGMVLRGLSIVMAGLIAFVGSQAAAFMEDGGTVEPY